MARRRNRKRNPMPRYGALYLVNPKKGKKRRKAAKKSKHSRRRKNGLALRTNRRRRNGLAIRTNRRRRNWGRRRNMSRRRNGLAIRTNKGRGKRRSNRRRNGYLIIKNRRRNAGRRRNMGIKKIHAKYKHGRKGSYVAWHKMHKGKGARFKFADYKKRHNRRRKNGYLIIKNRRKNPGDVISKGLGSAKSLVSRVPVVGRIVAPYLIPALLGAGGVALTYFGLQKVAPAVLPMLPAPVVDWVAPVGFTVAAMILSAGVSLVPSALLSASAKAMLASGMVVGAASVDTIRYLSGGGGFPVGDGGFYQIA